VKGREQQPCFISHELWYLKSSSYFKILALHCTLRQIDGVAATRDPLPGWTFLTNHTHVLVCLARDESMTLREVALEVGITERAVHSIVKALEDEGVLARTREGQRNRYRLNRQYRLRHPLESHRKIGDLLELIAK
jgi:DNA-binding transcriptional ArsR family regulator